MHVQVLANDDDGSNDAFDLVEERSSLVERAVTIMASAISTYSALFGGLNCFLQGGTK